jgi:DNA-binding NtrC family response regulator
MSSACLSLAASGPGCSTSEPPRVLIVDDLEDARWVLSILVRRAGWIPLTAATGAQALACIEQDKPDVVLLDIGLPDIDGFEVLARAKLPDKALQVIMLTANGKTHDAVRAIRAGAYDYLTKPFNNADVALTVRQALENRSAKRQPRRLPSQSVVPADFLMNCMGGSAAVKRVDREVERVAKTNFSVLVIGESGSGKELVSQAIHARSSRGQCKPMVAVDCGAIPALLIESELFGHEKGAFTGAHQAKTGAFELAAGGTIFLDEIGNLPLEMQGKLLRVLETRCIHRVGSAKEVVVDFRVVAATNADLLSMVEQQTFRGDLYHRLAEYTICVPPLRDRTDDLGFLVSRILEQTNQELGKNVQTLSPAAWGLVTRYRWPGNVRELRNQLRRAVLLCDDVGGLITPDHLGVLDERAGKLQEPDRRQGAAVVGVSPATHWLGDEADSLTPGLGLSLKQMTSRTTARIEREILLRALRLSHGNKALAARMLRIDYKTIHTKLKLYEIGSLHVGADSFGPESS